MNKKWDYAPHQCSPSFFFCCCHVVLHSSYTVTQCLGMRWKNRTQWRAFVGNSLSKTVVSCVCAQLVLVDLPAPPFHSSQRSLQPCVGLSGFIQLLARHSHIFILRGAWLCARLRVDYTFVYSEDAQKRAPFGWTSCPDTSHFSPSDSLTAKCLQWCNRYNAWHLVV